MHSGRPLISVLLPIRNAEPTLDEALQSLAVQSLRDFEVVAVNDGSTDETGRILEGWARRDERVRPLHRPANGLVAALNDGLAACRGVFVARMDADDVALPERLAAQLAFIAADPSLNVVATAVEGFADGGQPLGAGMTRYLDWMNGLTTHEQMERERFIESPVVHPSVFVRRETLARVDGYRDAGWAEDYDLWMRLFSAGARFGKVPRALLRWRDRPERATRTDGRYGVRRHRALKFSFLLEGPLKDPQRPIVFWGAGLEGKPFLRLLHEFGRPARAVIDLDPRKIGSHAGNVVHGARVVAVDALGSLLVDRPVVLVAVGVPTARPDIRNALQGVGMREGDDFWFLR